LDRGGSFHSNRAAAALALIHHQLHQHQPAVPSVLSLLARVCIAAPA
jgi:hypothetical protein